MELTEERRRELYGPHRNVRFQNIKDSLTRSHVLQNGEYNFTSDKLNRDIWRTSNNTDFSGAVLDPSLLAGTSSQLVSHFDMGNMSGKLLEKDIFRRSTTHADFRPKDAKKPEIQGISRDINWPDMAPRYMKERRVGPSEYTSTFTTNVRHRSAPNYPRVDTSKLQLPLNPEKFWRQRNTNFSLGSDNDGLISEQQRVYGRGKMAYQMEHKEKTAATDANSAMKEMDKESHVFRCGDYNDIVGNFVSTTTGDFGPRTVPPGEAALKKKLLHGQDDEEEDEDQCYANINKLQKYARENTVPGVFKDATEGGAYQTSAHFHFGHDNEVGQSIHGKDFLLSALVARKPPLVVAPPSAGKLLQYDPNLSKFGKTSSSVDFQDSKYEPYKDSTGKTALQINLDRRDQDSVILSFDLGRHKNDRQKSLNHSDFAGPPKGSRPAVIAPRHDVYVDYLQSDAALPYPAPPKNKSEASHNFMGMFSRGNSAIGWRSFRNRSTKGRLEDGRSTHFVVGYEPYDFVSETSMKFQGDTKTAQDVPFAGKYESIHPNKMPFISHSQNVLDLQATDPHITNTRESLHARMRYRDPRPEPSNTTSVMKKDYGPMTSRSVTRDQMRTLDKYDKVTQKEISDSHLFHTDTSGRNNFITTAMDDFIKPDTMTGRKYLAAR